MKTWLYSWFVYPILCSLAKGVGLFHPKMRETLKLRSWKNFLSLRFNAGEPIEYWVHVASHGELEYAIPLLEELKARQKRVLVTYYSISAKNPVEQLPLVLPHVSLVVPLPHDGLGLMKEFVTLAYGQGVRYLLLLKYELWPGLLWECNSHKIKVFLVDALRPTWFHRRLLHKLEGILSGYPSEIKAVSHPNIHVVGDTRVQRVIRRLNDHESKIDPELLTKLQNALSSRPTLVCGSMWPPDTQCLLQGLARLKMQGLQYNIIWVPHELKEGDRKKAQKGFKLLGYRTLDIDSKWAHPALPDQPLAIMVMKKGILVELYRLGKMAYVGGGFGDGVHSVWEPALAGCYVICGPRIRRSPESSVLESVHLLKSIHSPDQLSHWLKTGGIASPDFSGSLAEVLKEHVGAASRIIDICERH